jgi:S-formylglutathione hydrolase FrmB
MKRNLSILLLAGGFAALGLADEHADRMKAVGAAAGALRKDATAGTMDAAAKDAQMVADLLKKEEDWWSGKAADATKFAQDGQAAAKSIATAAAAGKAEDVAAGQKALGATCQGCHAAHREKVDGGGYKTKM